jgi:hypothetical protein
MSKSIETGSLSDHPFLLLILLYCVLMGASNSCEDQRSYTGVGGYGSSPETYEEAKESSGYYESRRYDFP